MDPRGVDPGVNIFPSIIRAAPPGTQKPAFADNSRKRCLAEAAEGREGGLRDAATLAKAVASKRPEPRRRTCLAVAPVARRRTDYTFDFAMFPVSDVIPSRTTPFVTVGLIVLNVLAFFYELQLTRPELQ